MARQRLFAVVRRLERVLHGFHTVTDEELLRRYATTQGTDQPDEPAFEALVWRQSGLIWCICRRITRDEHLAEEAFQDTFVALAANAARVRDVGRWLPTIARRAAVAVQKRRPGCARPNP